MRFALIGFVLLSTVVAIAAFTFMVQPVEPFMFYKDLGFNWEIIEWAKNAIRSPADIIDALAWSPGFYIPNFYQNSQLGDFVGIVAARALNNSWCAVKVVEVIQASVSAIGAYFMYASASGSRSWRLVFAALYAALPLNELMIRGNEDFGWISALLPGVIALARTILLRYGARGMPTAGIIAALGGYLVAIQFLLFTSVPVLLLSISGVRGLTRRRGSIGLLVFGLFSCSAVGAFYILPTFLHPLLSDSAPRAVSLATHDFFADFSENWIQLLAMIETEFTSSPISQFNAASAIPIVLIPTAVLWTAALVHIATAKNRVVTWANGPSVLIVAGCVVLSLGASIPVIGKSLWNLLYLIPHVSGIRTVDRFLAIPSLFIPFWGITAFERTSRRFPKVEAAAGFVALAICATFVVFDQVEHVFTVDHSISEREPQLDAVRNVVQADGARVATFVGVDGGSADDAPMYGRPQPVPGVTTDLGSRFLWAGVAGSGLLGRAGIGDIVTAPSWTYDESALPNVSNSYETIPRSTLRFSSPEGVSVWQIPFRPPVTAVRLDCAHGGPGAFDTLAGEARYDSRAFGDDVSRCRADDFIDFDPLDDWKMLRPIESWSGRQLIPHSPSVRDADYKHFLNRTLLNIPWYRNSIDGERPVFDENGAIQVTNPESATIVSHHAWPVGTIVCVRVAAHKPMSLELHAGTSLIGFVSIPQNFGFTWHRFRVTTVVASDTPVQLTIRPSEGSLETSTWAGIALDGIAVFRSTDRLQFRYHDAHLVASTLKRLTDTSANPGGNIASQDARVTFDKPERLTSLKPSPLSPGTLIATGSEGFATFKWMGSPGMYVVDTIAQLSPTSVLGLDAGSSAHCCAVFAPNGGTNATRSAIGIFYLTSSSTIRVRLTSVPFQASDGNRLISVRAAEIKPIEIDSRDTFSSPIDLALSDPLVAMRAFGPARGVEFNSDGMRALPGSQAKMGFSVKGRPGLIAVTIASADEGTEAGLATLQCGSHRVSTRLLVLRSLILSNTVENPKCTVAIGWGGPQMRLLALSIGTSSYAATLTAGRMWIPAGDFAPSVVKSDGRVDGAAQIAVLGCDRARIPTCRFPTSAFRDVTIASATSDDSLLEFTANEPKPVAQPIEVNATDLFRWEVVVRSTTDLAITQINDGNWILRSADREVDAESCDIVDSCFHDVVPGYYRLYHRWPRALIYGSLITASTLFVSLGILWLPRPHSRRREDL